MSELLSTREGRNRTSFRIGLYCAILLGVQGAIPAQSRDNQNVVSVFDTTQIAHFSGLGVCPREKLAAARLDRPSIAQNKVDHRWIVINLNTDRIVGKFDAGQTINVFGGSQSVQPQWSPDCRYFFYRALTDDGVQIWRSDLKTKRQKQITDETADVLRFELSDDGVTLIYETDAPRAAIREAEEREYEQGVLYDENIFPWHGLFETLPVNGRWASVRLWSSRSAGHLLSGEPRAIKKLTVKSSGLYPATGSSRTGLSFTNTTGADWTRNRYASSLIHPSGDRAAISVAQKRSISGRAIVSALGFVRSSRADRIQECSDHRCRGEVLRLLEWSHDAESIYFVAGEKRGAEGLYAWSPESDDVQTIVETEGLLGGEVDCAFNMNEVLCAVSDHGGPPRLTAFSLSSKAKRVLFDPNKVLRSKMKLKSERVQWKDGFGRHAKGILVYPREYRQGERYPLVITTYTCRGFLEGGSGDGGPEYVLAEHGILVLCIDFNWDMPSRELTEKYSRGPARYVAALAEYEAAIDMLVGAGIADRSRVGITGFSFSSQAVSYALTHSKAFHTVSLRGVGVWEPTQEILFHPEAAITKIAAATHNAGDDGHPPEVVFADIAVSMRVDRVIAPILVQASDSEYLGSLSAFTALKKARKPIEMYVFPDETHQLHQPVHRFVNFTRNLDWFRFWLQGYEDPDTDKVEQYARWRTMRDDRCAREDIETPSYCPTN